jgi:glycosyltransferase involved in cell wall biosynthesis
VTISVIIATYNRAALLDDCLAHLRAQRFEPGDEVIIVDNGSTDDTAAVVTRHQMRFPALVRCLDEPRPGKSRALTTALAVASGDVLAFTDDDVNADSDWLAAIRAAMADPALALAGGPVEPRWEQPAPQWLQLGADGYGPLAAPLALLDYGRTPSALGARTVLGANLAVRRDVIARVGGFAAHLGKLRGTLLSGEDHDLCRRVVAAGFRAQYIPTARVRHWVPARRATIRYFLEWFYWSGITNAALDEEAPAPRRSIAGLPLFLVRRFLAAFPAAPVAAITGNLPKAALHATAAAFAAGYAAKRWGIVRLDVVDTRQPVEEAA